MVKSKRGINYQLLVFSYTIVTVLVFSIMFSLLLFADFSKASLLSIILIVSGYILFIVGFIMGSILFWKFIGKRLEKGLVDWVIIFLIALFVALSLIVSALTTKFSSNELSFDKLDNMIQITWVVFGVSIALYTIIIGFISSSSGDLAKKLFSDFSISLYPIYCASVPLVISTIMIYCFYEKCIVITTTMAYVSFIVGVLCAPYCLLLCTHFLSNTIKNKKISDPD